MSVAPAAILHHWKFNPPVHSGLEVVVSTSLGHGYKFHKPPNLEEVNITRQSDLGRLIANVKALRSSLLTHPMSSMQSSHSSWMKVVKKLLYGRE